MRGDDAAVSRRLALRGRGRARAEASRDLQLVREAVQVRGTPAALRPRRRQRADVPRAEGEARVVADAAVSMSPRGRARQSLQRRAGIVTAIVVVLALILLLSGHWILGIIFGVAAAAAVAAFLQLRTVR